MAAGSYLSRAEKNERAYLSSIWIYMLGNVFFTHTHTHTEMGDGEAVRLIINISVLPCSYWSVLQALKVYLRDGIF